MNKNDTIIVVHPFTSVEFALVRIKERGYKIITIKTQLDKVWIEHEWSCIKKYSDFIFESGGKVETDLNQIQNIIQTNELNIVGVMNGFDGSLFYSDYLANNLLGYSLDLEYSQLRANKFLVNEKLRQTGVNHIKSIFIESIDDFKHHFQQISQFKLPIIVKPAANSAARSDVKVIHAFDDMEKHIAALLSKANIFASAAKQQVLIQEFIKGDEYIVNSVSYRGQHFTAGVFKYRKHGDSFSGIEIVGPDNKLEILTDYCAKCLTAVKNQYGMTHNEIILTPEGIPYLVEMNNRMAGADVPIMSMDCYGVNEIDIFLDICDNKPIPISERRINRYGVMLFFTNFYVENPTHLNLSDVISDTRMIVFRPAKIDKVKPNAEDLYHKVSAGVYLSHFSKMQLEQDIKILLDRDQDGSLFVV